MQVQVFEWLLRWINCLAALAGLQVISLETELMPAGCRAIPKDHSDFDPALADYFRSKGMRNGKHITLATDYSVIARWNHFNKKQGKDERSYGSDRAYANKWGADVSRQTWGKHMDELAALGLVSISTVNNKPAYQALPYRIVNNALMFVENSHGHSEDFHGHSTAFHGHSGVFHGHQIIESSESLGLESLGIQSSTTPARDAAVDSQSTSPEDGIDSKTEISEVRSIPTGDEGEMDIMESVDSQPSPRPQTPSSAAPLAPPDGWRDFFKTATDWELCEMARRFGVGKVNDWITQTKTMTLENPGGFVVTRLRSGMSPPPKRLEPGSPEYWQDAAKRYISGPYADIIKH